MENHQTQSKPTDVEQPSPEGLSSSALLCAYCNGPIRQGQPTVPDEWGEPGARMHIGCSAEDQDGQDLDREFGDS